MTTLDNILGLTDTPAGAVLNLRIVPRAAKNAIQGEHGDALKIRLCAPPVDGAANDAVLAVLAAAFDLPRRDLILLRGAAARIKLIGIALD